MGQEEWEALEAQALAILTAEDGWAAFWTAASPHVEQWVGSPSFLGKIAADEDHRREVVIQTWEKLQDRDHAKLRTFFERPRDGDSDSEPGRRFKAWMRRVVKNIGIDYMRSLPEYVRKRSAAPEVRPSQDRSHDYWQSIVSITSSAAAFSSPVEGRTEAQRMLDFLDQEISPRRRRAVALHDEGRSDVEIARELGIRDAREASRVVSRARERLKFRAALELWSHGFSDDEIAEKLDLDDAAAAERMIKAAKELLRRNFR